MNVTTIIELNVRLYGAFRKFHHAPLHVAVPAGSNAAQVKAALGLALRDLNPQFHDDELLAKSALATHQQVLPEDAQLFASAELAILPPVCGG